VRPRQAGHRTDRASRTAAASRTKCRRASRSGPSRTQVLHAPNLSAHAEDLSPTANRHARLTSATRLATCPEDRPLRSPEPGEESMNHGHARSAVGAVHRGGVPSTSTSSSAGTGRSTSRSAGHRRCTRCSPPHASAHVFCDPRPSDRSAARRGTLISLPDIPLPTTAGASPTPKAELSATELRHRPLEGESGPAHGRWKRAKAHVRRG
jgi:hypothetical protein